MRRRDDMSHTTVWGSRLCVASCFTALLVASIAGGCSPGPSSTPANVGSDQNTAAPELNDRTSDSAPSTAQATSSEASAEEVTETAVGGLPRLLDLGAGKCIPCKMMAPILDELKEKYEGTLEVEFIDVWKNPDEAEKYGIDTIPTQIFFDASGKERFRHVGFFAKEEILAKWKELGVELEE